jgi:predicted hydrocarbon binding protein
MKSSDQAELFDYTKRGYKEGMFQVPWSQLAATKFTGIDIAINALYIVQSAMEFLAGNPDPVEVVRREGGAIATVHDCPLKNAKPELCVFVSHLGAEMYCEFAHPTYECLWTHHMTNGDPFCRYIIKKKSITYKDPDSLGKIISTLPRVDLTDEQLAQMGNSFLGGAWLEYTIGFKDFNGSQKTIEVLGANAKRIGKNFGSLLIEANMLPARDISVMGGFIHQFGESFTMKGRITSMAPGVYVKEINDCPFKTAPPEICKQWEAFYNGMLEKINPGLEFHYDRMMTTGDKTCKWVIAKR